jgi:signal transduction histidine kinase
MWPLPKIDLKYRLTLRIMMLSAFCFAAAAGYVLVDIDRSARARIDMVAGIAARELELQHGKMAWVMSPQSNFPDLQTIAAALTAPGLCIAYRTASGDIRQHFCGGSGNETTAAPAVFVAFYGGLFDPGRESTRPVRVRGETIGEAVASVDPATLTAAAWREARRLMAVMLVTLLLLCGLAYAALARALRPTRLIRAGLERIAANDLSARLPPFDLAELSAIGAVFNQLAENLDTALAERNALTRRLIALQDDERRHLARELHDEFGQCLAAIRALAASARHSAAQACPHLVAECDGIARAAADMTETLRGALFRLRPPDVDELGLPASLEGLIAGWNGRLRGRTRFEITLTGSFHGLPAELGGNLYRVAQEAITNAAKHAGATRVVLQLAMRERQRGPTNGAQEIELAVDDDGAGEHDRAGPSGMGLLGMRERVAALGGHLTFAAGRPAGSTLRVVIPVPVHRGASAADCAA